VKEGGEKMITAKEWREMSIEEIIGSIELAIRVLQQDKKLKGWHLRTVALLASDLCKLIFDAAEGVKGS